MLGFGIVTGIAYRFFLHTIHDREFRASGFVVTTFWVSLYLFERSWVKTLGLAGTLMIYAGLATIVFDHYLRSATHQRKHWRPRIPVTRISHG